MRSLLSPVVAGFYMEICEFKALLSPGIGPLTSTKIFDVLIHGEEELDKFLTHLNSVYPEFNSP